MKQSRTIVPWPRTIGDQSGIPRRVGLLLDAHRSRSEHRPGLHRSDADIREEIPMKVAALLLAGLLSFVPAARAWQAPPARVEFLDSGKVVPANLPFSEAVRVDHTLYLSGQVGIVPGTMQLVAGGLEAETRQAMDNIRTTLQAHGLVMGDLVKCTVMLADMARWNEFNAVYRTYFSGRYPARSALGAHGLALGAQVEIECIAVAGAAR
jgi:2-iminobutanoate/2-iminopropanoate deaminase